MSIVYNVWDIETATYIQKETLEEAVELATNIAFDFYMTHVHWSPVAKVEVLEDGSEVWTSSNGEDITNNIIMKALREKIIANITLTK